MLTRRLTLTAAAAACLAFAPPSWADAPLRIVVPLGPGSGADVMARWLARRYEQVSGKPAIVENKPGANLAIGTMAVINAPADGRTLLYITPSSMVINPIVEKDLPYNPQRDLTPIVQLSEGPSVLVVRPDSPYKSFADLTGAAKAKPGTVSYANYGHYYRFAALDIERMTGAKFNHVSYKGGGQANTDVIGGQVDVHGTDIAGVLPLLQSGKLRPLVQNWPQTPPVFARRAHRGRVGPPGLGKRGLDGLCRQQQNAARCAQGRHQNLGGHRQFARVWRVRARHGRHRHATQRQRVRRLPGQKHGQIQRAGQAGQVTIVGSMWESPPKNWRQAPHTAMKSDQLFKAIRQTIAGVQQRISSLWACALRSKNPADHRPGSAA